MNCAQFAQFLDEYESLDAMRKAELKEHCAQCEECAKEYDFFMSMLNAAKTMPPIKADDSFLTNLNARIDKEIVNAPVHKNVWEHVKLNAHRYSAAAACAALIAVVGVNNADFIEKITNPLTDADIAPVVSETPEDNSDALTGLIITSTLDPKQSEQPAPTAAATASPVESAAPTAKPVVTVKPSTQTTPRVTNAPAQVNRISATQKPTQAPVATQVPAPVETPTAIKAEEIPAVASVSETNEPYMMQQGEYELPGRTAAAPKNSDVASGYSLDNTPNYLKVAQADMERVRNLISQYSEDNNGDIYLMKAENIAHILAILSNEGIEFDDALVSTADGNVAFKLIIS